MQIDLALIFFLITSANCYQKFSFLPKLVQLKHDKVLFPSVSTCETKRRLVDPQAIDTIQSNPTFLSDVFTQSSDVFATSFTSRILGSIIGNLVAGICTKIVYDFYIQLTSNKSEFVPAVIENEIKSIPPISTSDWFKLLLCITVDLIGDSSFFLPGVGEFEDVAWAPISAFVLRYLFASDTVALAEFTKEILPFSDIIPFATTVWLLENVFVDNPFRKLLKLKDKI